MKLGKLLGAGKSFFGWQESVSYRRNKLVYLPKFNPGKNPFLNKSKEVESSVSMAPEQVAVTSATVQETIVPAFASVKSEPAKAAFARPEPSHKPNWAEKLNPFRGKPAKAAPSAPMPTVQPEFSLDGVKVVHNDLSDADVEVVPMKSRTEKVSTPAMTSVPMEFLGEPMLKSA